jgi:hypothetical protein
MYAFLGVKGSRVQVPPSRPFFEHSCPEMGTKAAMIVPTWPNEAREASLHGG